MKVPLNVGVHCLDGRYGRSTHIIINPKTHKVTHVVVNKLRVKKSGRQVPVSWIKETTPDLILLNNTRQAVDNLDPLVATEFVQKKLREFGDEPQLTLLWPHIESKKRIISEKRLQIPRDVQAVQKGARVRATDGLIGHVSEFIVDHKTGHITDLVLQEGLPWDKKQVILAVVEIERIEENTVYLKLNKQAVKKRASKFKGWN
jgi:sporulation protein YlmC with PRC-barrel domain